VQGPLNLKLTDKMAAKYA